MSQGRAPWSGQQKVASGGQSVDAVLSTVVRNHSSYRNQLPLARGIAESQYLDSHALERLALFIQGPPGDRSQRHNPDRQIAHSLSGRKGQHLPRSLGRTGTVNLAGETGLLHPQPVISRLKLNGKV